MFVFFWLNNCVSKGTHAPRRWWCAIRNCPISISNLLWFSLPLYGWFSVDAGHFLVLPRFFSVGKASSVLALMYIAFLSSLPFSAPFAGQPLGKESSSPTSDISSSCPQLETFVPFHFCHKKTTSLDTVKTHLWSPRPSNHKGQPPVFCVLHRVGPMYMPLVGTTLKPLWCLDII